MGAVVLNTRTMIGWRLVLLALVSSATLTTTACRRARWADVTSGEEPRSGCIPYPIDDLQYYLHDQPNDLTLRFQADWEGGPEDVGAAGTCTVQLSDVLTASFDDAEEGKAEFEAPRSKTIARELVEWFVSHELETSIHQRMGHRASVLLEVHADHTEFGLFVSGDGTDPPILTRLPSLCAELRAWVAERAIPKAPRDPGAEDESTTELAKPPPPQEDPSGEEQ